MNMSDAAAVSSSVGAIRAQRRNDPLANTPIEKIIVAIHGIGSQVRSDTIRSVAQRFGDRNCPPLPVMPIGYFNLGNDANVRVSRLNVDPKNSLARIGFAEVFWADIPAQVVKANDTLEETKAWGRTVVSRAEAEYRDNVDNGVLTPEDFQLGIGVVEEIVETIDVLEKLFYVTASAGLFKFELQSLLRDYVGDVQLVTDFPYYRERITYRFHKALSDILSAYFQLYPQGAPEIYIVAHSEGSVISFLGLLQALSGLEVVDPDSTAAAPVPVDSRWIRYVRGFMTIGSPIDKHLVLWPQLWRGLELTSHLDANGAVVFDHHPQGLTLNQPIKWRNYYDHGDPIGFQLDTAATIFQGCKAFEFDTKRHDIGFSRYWLPGKAHNDYWQDAQVFGHFIDDVVSPTKEPAKRPASYRLVDKVSLAIPYALVFLLHLVAVFVLYKTVAQTQMRDLPMDVALLSVLLTCITVAARLPRLVKASGFRWQLASLLVLLVGVVPCVWLLPHSVSGYLGGPLAGFANWLDLHPDTAERLALIVAAFVIAGSGWFLPRRPKLGRRVLISIGTVVVAFIVVWRLRDGTSDADVWPVLLAGGVFLYAWWLGILLFDLTFVWHRYIRRAVAIRTLTHWKVAKSDARPNTMLGLGEPVAVVPPAATGMDPLRPLT